MALPLSSRNSDANNYAEINRLIKKVEGKDRVQIFKDDAGDRRVLIGKGKNGFYGLKVSKADKDVYEAPDSDLVFNSDQNIFKIASSGTISVLFDPGLGVSTATTTVAHGLGFTPAYMAYLQNAYGSSGQFVCLPVTEFDDGSGLVQYHLTLITTSTDVVLKVRFTMPTGFSATTFTVKYYLLQETAN